MASPEEQKLGHAIRMLGTSLEALKQLTGDVDIVKAALLHLAATALAHEAPPVQAAFDHLVDSARKEKERHEKGTN